MIDFLITTPSINVCDALLYNINLIMDKLDSRCNLSDICCNATFAVTAHTVDAGSDDVIRLHIDESGDIGMLTCMRALMNGSDHRDMDVVTTSMPHTIVACSMHSKHFHKTKTTMWLDFSLFCDVCESKAYFMFTTCCITPSEGFISFTNDIDESNGAYIPFYEMVSMGGAFISGGHVIKSPAPWLHLVTILLAPHRVPIATVVQKIVPGTISWNDVDRTLVFFRCSYNFDVRQYGPMIVQGGEVKMLSAVNIRRCQSFRQIKILKGCKHLVLYDADKLEISQVHIDELTRDNPQCNIYVVIFGKTEDVVLKSYGTHILLHV